MAANASPRAQRNAVLASAAADFAMWRLAVNCSTPKCGGERAYSIADIVALHKSGDTLGALVLRLRCRACGRPPATVYLETGPEISARGQHRRLALSGAE